LILKGIGVMKPNQCANSLWARGATIDDLHKTIDQVRQSNRIRDPGAVIAAWCVTGDLPSDVMPRRPTSPALVEKNPPPADDDAVDEPCHIPQIPLGEQLRRRMSEHPIESA